MQLFSFKSAFIQKTTFDPQTSLKDISLYTAYLVPLLQSQRSTYARPNKNEHTTIFCCFSWIFGEDFDKTKTRAELEKLCIFFFFF